MKYLGAISDDKDLVTKEYVDDAVATATGSAPATVAPLMDGTAAVGTALKYAREDHVHPTDTSRANFADTVTLKEWTYSDCNSATSTGWYFISATQVSGGISNFPPTSASVYFQVLSYSDNYKTQFAFSREQNTHSIWWRTKVTGGWGMWHSLSDGSKIASGYISANGNTNLSLAVPSTSMNACYFKVWGGTSSTASEAVYYCSSLSGVSSTLTVLTKTNILGGSPINVGIANDGVNGTYRLKLDNTGSTGYCYTVEVGHNWAYFVY